MKEIVMVFPNEEEEEEDGKREEKIKKIEGEE